MYQVTFSQKTVCLAPPVNIALVQKISSQMVTVTQVTTAQVVNQRHHQLNTTVLLVTSVMVGMICQNPVHLALIRMRSELLSARSAQHRSKYTTSILIAKSNKIG